MSRRNRTPEHPIALIGAALLMISAHSIASHAQSNDEPPWEEKPYTIIDGKVNFGTYNGFRRYHSSCHVCHGPECDGQFLTPVNRSLSPQQNHGPRCRDNLG